MKKHLRDEWLAALRSGTYQQGEGELRVDDGDGPLFCCLGVYCEVRGLRFEDGGYILPTGARQDTTFLLEYYIAELADLTTQSALADMNDKGASFAEIADWIEQHIPVDEKV